MSSHMFVLHSSVIQCAAPRLAMKHETIYGYTAKRDFWNVTATFIHVTQQVARVNSMRVYM